MRDCEKALFFYAESLFLYPEAGARDPYNLDDLKGVNPQILVSYTYPSLCFGIKKKL